MDLAREMEIETAAVLKTEVIAYDTAQALAAIRGWDSLRFMKLLMGLEKKWNIRFEAHEVTPLKTWGELIALIRLKRS